MAKKPQTESQSNFPQRVTKEEKKLIVDTYKLLPAPVWKRIGKSEDFFSNRSDWAEFEHTHIFRSQDENGKKHTKSAPIAGHFHLIEVEESTNPNEAPKIISVSGPMVQAKKKNPKTGRVEMVDIPVNDFDDHTHDWVFLGHYEMAKRVMNMEAAKIQAQVEAKGAGMSGVVSGD